MAASVAAYRQNDRERYPVLGCRLWQIGKRFSFDLLLGGIVRPFGDPAQLEATAVKARIRANALRLPLAPDLVGRS
jgi:hypothetical protein